MPGPAAISATSNNAPHRIAHPAATSSGNYRRRRAAATLSVAPAGSSAAPGDACLPPAFSLHRGWGWRAR